MPKHPKYFIVTPLFDNAVLTQCPHSGMTEKGIMACIFTFGLDLCDPKAHCICLFSQGNGELGNHRPADDLTIQYPQRQEPFEAMAMIFHAFGLMTQLSQVEGMYQSQQVPYKLFGCTVQGGPSLFWGQHKCFQEEKNKWKSVPPPRKAIRALAVYQHMMWLSFFYLKGEKMLGCRDDIFC
jgi:hypothetical protein